MCYCRMGNQEEEHNERNLPVLSFCLCGCSEHDINFTAHLSSCSLIKTLLKHIASVETRQLRLEMQIDPGQRRSIIHSHIVHKDSQSKMVYVNWFCLSYCCFRMLQVYLICYSLPISFWLHLHTERTDTAEVFIFSFSPCWWGQKAHLYILHF